MGGTEAAAGPPLTEAVRPKPNRQFLNGDDTPVRARNVPQERLRFAFMHGKPDGAALGDLTAATGWQVHSVRAALTGLRKEGKELAREKDAAGVTHYRLAANA